MEDPFFRELVARSRDAILTVDTGSEILFANDGVERTLGYDPTELEGTPLTDLMPERYRDRHRAAVAQYVASGERTLDWDGVELPAIHADGHEVPLSITFEEHEHQGERLFSGIMRDVTERRERERELAETNEQLERFAAVVSHDLREPLNTAQATLALLEEDSQTGEATAAYVDDLASSLERMEVLVEGVLTLAKSGRSVGETAPVDLGDAARRAWDLVGAEGATLAVGTGDVTIEADEERLQALLENLFRNAVEHGRRDGQSLRVEVGLVEAGATDATGAADGSGPAGFYVADDGPGIPPEEREAVFERGYSTVDAGTGLGLSIVRTIAAAHGWTTAVTESERGGARFEFRLQGR